MVLVVAESLTLPHGNLTSRSAANIEMVIGSGNGSEKEGRQWQWQWQWQLQLAVAVGKGCQLTLPQLICKLYQLTFVTFSFFQFTGRG